MSDTSDPSDVASAREAHFLAASLAAVAMASAPNPAHSEAAICRGCDYATAASTGKTCDSWGDCLSDVSGRTKSVSFR